jgi:CheY-like chemotaxis protein
VQSEPGRGTTFSILWPCATGEEPSLIEELEASPRGTERLLLVDDEEALVDLMSRALRLLGYRTTAVTDGPEALRRFQESPDEYDLVVADLTMPRLTGLALAREIHRLRPDLPVVLCTGFRGVLSGEDAAQAGIREVVQKPVTPRQLARAVRCALDS